MTIATIIDHPAIKHDPHLNNYVTMIFDTEEEHEHVVQLMRETYPNGDMSESLMLDRALVMRKL